MPPVEPQASVWPTRTNAKESAPPGAFATPHRLPISGIGHEGGEEIRPLTWPVIRPAVDAAVDGSQFPHNHQAPPAASHGAYEPDFCDSPPSRHTPGSTSEESMKLTPPESPTRDPDSPIAPAGHLEQLSLEQNGPPWQPSPNHQAFDVPSATASKRSASPSFAQPPGKQSTEAVKATRDAQVAGSRRPPPVNRGQPKHRQKTQQHGVRAQSIELHDHAFVELDRGGATLSAQPRPVNKNRQPAPRNSAFDSVHSPPHHPQYGKQDSGPVGHRAPSSSAELPRTLQIDSEQHLSKLPKGPLQPTPRVRYPGLILQPDSSPISQDQLAVEVEAIYTGLVMVETKCINIDKAQTNEEPSSLGPDQWQALIALHRTLLYEHHDFLMATQHPSATSELQSLPSENSMPARMWKHGIHAFLEVLRHRRPESQEYMLSFICLAYQMMGLLYETVPSFLDTWIECLGDLARYRMAIEENTEIHAQWGGVASRWYTMAADRHPTVGRLNHHLGILERPSLRKLFFYTKALTCVTPFLNARDSLKSLCGPIVRERPTTKCCSPSAEARIVTYYALALFNGTTDDIEETAATAATMFSQLPTSKVRDIGVSLALVDTAALLGLGDPNNTLWQLYNEALLRAVRESRPSMTTNAATSSATIRHPPQTTHLFSDQVNSATASARNSFAYKCMNSVLRFYDDRSALRDILPFVHVMLVWFHSLLKLQSRTKTNINTYSSLLGPDVISWGGLAEFLNALKGRERIPAHVLKCAGHGTFLSSDHDATDKPLSEDYLLRGLVWTQWYFRPGLFDGTTDQDGRSIETPGMQKARADRVMWLGLSLASHTDYLRYDPQRQVFSTTETAHSVPSGERPVVIGVGRALPVPGTQASSLPVVSPSSEADDGFTVVTKHRKPPRASAKAAAKPRKVRQDYTGVRVVNDDSMQWEQ